MRFIFKCYYSKERILIISSIATILKKEEQNILVMSEVSPKNRLNELTPQQWLRFTKTWFIHNPPPRKKAEMLHPAKYPEKMIEEFVRFFTKEGGIVFDPFLGTGSTLVACHNSNRNGIGIELQEKYAKIARERIQLLESQLKLDEQGSKLKAKQVVLQGNSAELEKYWKEYSLPLVDLVITSPPYGPMLNKKGLVTKKREEEGLDLKYSDDTNDLGNATGYENFLQKLMVIFTQMKPLIKEDGYLVVILQNYMDKGEYKMLAWDFAREMTQHFQLRGERIWCFHPETIVWTKEGGKEIKKINRGDLVLTHKGTFGEVKKTFTRGYSGDILRITTRSLNKEIKCTPEHKLLSIQRLYWPNSTAFQPFKQVSGKTPSWIEANKLKVGDILLLPIPKIKEREVKIDLTKYTSKEIVITNNFFTTKNKGGQTFIPKIISLSPEFCRLVGYFISEGHGSSDHALTIASYSSQIKEDIVLCFRKVFPGIHLNVTKKEVLCYSRLLSEIFSTMFGTYAKNKFIPPFLLNADFIFLKHLLKGLWAGDGCISNDRAAYKTISEELANSLIFILLRFRIVPNIQYSKKYGIQLSLRGRTIKQLAEILDRNDIIIDRKKNNNQIWQDENYFYLPIRKLERENYEGLVYNLMVEPNNTYVTYSFSSHNCQDNKTLYPYGYRYSFVPNVHHHYCLVFRNKVSDTPKGNGL